MSCDLRISVAIECSKANSDVVGVFRHPRKHGRPATGTKAPPSAGRGLIFGYQIFTSNYAVALKWNSRVGRKGCPIGASTEVAVTKPNLADRSENLELEAAAKAFSTDRLWWQGILFWHRSFSTTTEKKRPHRGRSKFGSIKRSWEEPRLRSRMNPIPESLRPSGDHGITPSNTSRTRPDAGCARSGSLPTS
jgi:hypothetical protein